MLWCCEIEYAYQIAHILSISTNGIPIEFVEFVVSAWDMISVIVFLTIIVFLRSSDSQNSRHACLAEFAVFAVV